MEKELERNFDNEFIICFKSKTDTDRFYWINYTVYEIPAIDGSDNTPVFNKIGYTGSGEYVDKLPEAQIYIKGFLKWDGCTEMEFIDAQHFCGRKYAHILTRIIDAIYDTAIIEFNFTDEDTK